MARVIHADVIEIFTTTISDLSTFINIANLFVNQYLESKLDDDLLTEIERWLSAHFACALDPRAKTEKVDVLSTTFTGTFGKGLESTPYGQSAILLDTSGTLAAIAKNGVSKAPVFGMIEYNSD